MKRILIVFLKYYLFWVLFLTAFKFFFVIYNYRSIVDLPAIDFWGIFSHGMVMDFSVAGYLCLFPGIIFGIGFLITSRFSSCLLKYYTLIVLICLTFLGLTDAGLYRAWGSRLNSQVLIYLKTPGGVFASLSWWQLILFPILLISIVWISYFLYNRLLPQKKLQSIRTKWYGIPVILFLTAVLIIPIRGGFNRSPLNHSSVYFSENLQANQFAYNYFWNFIDSVLKNKNLEIDVHYMTHFEAETILKERDKNGLKAPQIIHPVDGKPTNIILVLLESFSNKIIEPLGGLSGITPRLNEFCKQGIAFRSFFATGNRSDKGMSALIGGHPSDMRRATMLAFPDKMSELDYFPKYFADRGYSMSFYYGGDVNFYNTRAVMIQSGFDKIVSKSDFPLELGLKQKWGVPDEYLYARLYKDLQKEKEPFFSMVYNISSHEPYDIQDYSKFKGKSVEDKYLNVASYADSCLGVFIDSLRQNPFWRNTLVIITADHTSLEPGSGSIAEPTTYRIPLILIGGVVKDSFISNRFGNQNDLAPMLLKQLGWEHKPDILSKDFLVDGNYAFYFREEGWGFMSPGMGWFDNVNTQTQEFFYNNTPEKTDSVMHFAKAYVQYLHDIPLQNK